MKQNPYQAPAVVVSDPKDKTVPESVLRDIRNGWIAAVILGAITLLSFLPSPCPEHRLHYNFGRIHKTLRVTPAMQAWVSDHVWSLEEIAKWAN